MVKQTEPLEVEIETLDPDGFGIPTGHRMGVFGSLPGERVIARPFTRKRKRTFARTDTVFAAAADRVTPFCPAADVCGGCSLQHMDTTAQVDFKQRQLFELLGPNNSYEVMSPLYGPVREYRAKARLGAKYVEKKGKVLVGFREKMAPLIAEIDHCGVLRAPVGALVPELGALIGALSCPASIPQIEVAVGDDEAALVFRHLEELTQADMACLEAFGRHHGVSLYLQPGEPASAHKVFPRDGNERVYYELPEFGLQLGFHPLDFVQINAEINRAMVSRALSLLELQADDVVFDAFCGIGNFSLAAATRVRAVYGVESARTSVARARENAVRNRIDNCAFECADLTAESLDLRAFAGANKAVLDPPRTGAQALVKKLASSEVCRVVYVSCNPQTLARDANLLAESGYKLERAGVIDMFPHTTHIESIAVFFRSC